MNYIINFLMPYFIKYLNIIRRRKVVLSRMACVGKEVFYIKNNSNVFLYNFQKMRLDLLFGLIEKNVKDLNFEELSNNFKREDVLEIMRHQTLRNVLKYTKSLEFFMMDSYSELTDQRFENKKDGWAFCCHYGDIKNTDCFKKKFISKDLLEIENIEETYTKFLNWFEQNLKDKKLIFLHYSTKFDKREKFKERANEILRVMLQLEKEKDYIINLYLDDEYVFPNEEEDFPYHYSHETYIEYVEQWKEKEKKWR